MNGTLFVVATPIGNLKDISFRALSVLNSVDYIVCEDTRKTGNLLNLTSKMLTLENSKRPQLISYYEENEIQRIPEVIKVLKMNLNVALVSDAGTPTVSDPGFKLVRECIKEGIRVESIPGPSSVISALVSSGLPTDKFLFLGFLPKKQGHKKAMLGNLNKTLKLINSTVIIFESPYRLLKTLKEIGETFGDIEVVIARELTKIHEEVRKDVITNQIKYYKNGVKGEIVILFSTKG